jgi:diphosphomevalonate decarboxylase
MSRECAARACSNIALIKYWGKSPLGENRTHVPSLSLALEALTTHTRVRFDRALSSDEVTLDGQPAAEKAKRRVVRLLDELRALAGSAERAQVISHNDFPTASGLASSASGFAALALAASAALGLGASPSELSAVARRASASAARSLFGGWVELLAEADAAAQVAPPDWLDLRVVIALTTLGPKAVGSTEGMVHTQATSPYYAAWVGAAPALFERAKAALLARDFATLGEAMEQSTLMMHASMLAARPALVYLRPATLAVLDAVRGLRGEGVSAYATMDAGPHVKVFVPSGGAARVQSALAAVPGVERVLTSSAGAGATLLEA